MDKTMTELCDLAAKYGTDRHPGAKHGYTPFYYGLFKDRRESVKKILEIGVGEGAGLRMWQDFFPNAMIYGADNDTGRIFKKDRIHVFKCDQSVKEDLKALIELTGSDLDFVVDDGSHKPEDQVLTCLTLMPHLKKETVYIIEDVLDLGAVQDGLHEYRCFVPTLVPARRKFNRWGHRYIDRLMVVERKNE